VNRGYFTSSDRFSRAFRDPLYFIGYLNEARITDYYEARWDW
jgi:hypothetical protein